MLDVGYAVRQGKMTDGQSRSNFVGAQVTVDLPFFTGNRQDRRLQASADQLVVTQLDRDIHYKDLLKELTAQYAIWQSLSKRENMYRQHLQPEAKQNSKAALLAYKNTTTDLSTVLRAYSNELTIRLEQIQIQVERAKARAALLYLEGVTQ
jgi:outer membrane protein TolC